MGKKSTKEDRPTSQETREFWRDWRRKYRLTASGKSLEEVRREVREKHEMAWALSVSLISVFKWIGILIIEYISISAPLVGLLNNLSKDYRKTFSPEDRKTKTGKMNTDGL
jgi:hypothetical protein